MMSTPKVLADVRAERERQHWRWGEQNLEDGTGHPIHATWRDFVQNSCDTALKGGFATWRHILEEEVYEALAESDPVRLRAELIQVAAVAIQWVEHLDRRSQQIGRHEGALKYRTDGEPQPGGDTNGTCNTDDDRKRNGTQAFR